MHIDVEDEARRAGEEAADFASRLSNANTMADVARKLEDENKDGPQIANLRKRSRRQPCLIMPLIHPSIHQSAHPSTHQSITSHMTPSF